MSDKDTWYVAFSECEDEHEHGYCQKHYHAYALPTLEFAVWALERYMGEFTTEISQNASLTDDLLFQLVMQRLPHFKPEHFREKHIRVLTIGPYSWMIGNRTPEEWPKPFKGQPVGWEIVADHSECSDGNCKVAQNLISEATDFIFWEHEQNAN